MKLLNKTVFAVVTVIAILIISVSLMENKFTEADLENYVNTSQRLFANAGIEPKSKFVNTDGPVRNVHYYEIGSGEPLIIIHGGGGYASQWYPVMKLLSSDFHLYVVDRPGCGLTDYFEYDGVDLPSHGTQFIRSFMDAIGIEKAHLLGHSMGGFFSLNFAYDFPNRVEKIVLVGHPAGATQDIPFMMRLLGVPGINKLLHKLIGDPSVEGAREFYGRMLVADASKLTELYLQNDVNAQLIPGTRRSFSSLLENCVGLGGFKNSYLIKQKMLELNKPVYFIIGDKDVWDTIDNAKGIAAEMENSSFEVIENAGHLPWLDYPELSSGLISKALNE